METTMLLKRGLLIGLAFVVGVAALIYWRSGREPGSSASAKRPTAAKTVKHVATGRATHWEPYSPLVDDVDPPGTARLEGQVIDSQDHGVGKATVIISSNPPRTTLTEEDGSFVFEKLITRQYKLRARAGSLVGGPIKYRVKVAGEPLIIRMRAGVTVDVKVVDGVNRRPIAGAVVTLDQERAQTNSDGTATFEGISSGYVVLAARAEGFGLVQKLFEVTESKTSRVQAKLVLSAGAAVSGTVRDAKGKPVRGATVYALDMAKAVPLGSSPISYVRTDAAGKYSITAVAAGTYRIVAHKVGLAPAQSEPLAVDGKTARDGIDIMLEAGATLSGRVLDKNKAPAASATVKLLLASGSSAATLGKLRRTVTDQSGAFRLVGLPRRQFEALAYAEGASSAARKIDLRKSDVTDAIFLLTVDGRISGQVVDGAGKPLTEVQVTATGDFWGGAKVVDLKLRGSAQVITDGGGAFNFSGLPEGKYQLRASRSMRPEFGSAPGAVAAKTGDTRVKLVLLAPGGAKGIVVFEDGSPATAYAVNVGYPPTRPVLSESGAFLLSKLRPGKYDLTFSSSSFADKTLRNVQIAPDKIADLGTIKVARGRSVKGRVLDAEGHAVANATVVMGSRLVGDGSSLVLELGIWPFQ
ncbi:MAG: carboxypeptidase regulatory-like domain-containing protein, partial [Deltaproteobacteria bacterium]|nr:carboxypeptidase regulatory-like domain-containing protein [Deltaproteobacteria bacterium]